MDARVIDSLNRLQQDIGGTTYSVAPTQAITQYGYDNNANVTSTTDPLGRVTTHTYDALNRLVSVIDPYNGSAKPTNYTYDTANNLTRVTDPENKATDYTYNGHNNLITQTSPDTGTTKFTYNAVGNVVTKLDAMNRCSLTTYDNLHRATAIRYFASTNATTNTAAGCAAATTATATVEETVAYTYDAAAGGAGAKGRITKIADNAGTTDYTYDANGRVLTKKHTLASANSGGATNLAKSITYAYNSAGQLVSTTTPSGQLIAYSYGAPTSTSPGKVTGISVNGIDVIKGSVYAPFGPNGGWSWGNHNGTSLINQHLRIFDKDYRPIAIASDPQGYNRNIVWDQANRITSITIPGASTPSITVPGVTNAFSLNQQFAYDQLDRLTAFNAGVAGATTDTTGMALLPNESFTYDGVGNRKSRTTQAPGVTSTQATSYVHGTGTLNSNHRLVSAAGQINDAWNYDNTGNATFESSAALWGGYGSSGGTTSPIFGTNSTGTANKALANVYDAKNRLSKTAIATANTPEASTQTSADSVTYRLNALGQRVQKIGAGSFAAPTVFPFAITLSNPPTQAQLQALNLQVTAFHANSRFVYDEQGRLLGEYAKDGKLIQETVWFDDLPVAIVKPKGASAHNPVSGTGTTGNQGAKNTGANGNTAAPAAPTNIVNVEIFYVHPDHLGTPRVITASAPIAATQGTGITSAQTMNKAVWRWDSDPFGSNATATSSPNENPNTLNQIVGTATLPYLFVFDNAFPGQKRDRESGKHYNYFRDYDPSIGRFPQSDPIGLKGGLSTYSYVRNGPTQLRDPLGLVPWPWDGPGPGSFDERCSLPGSVGDAMNANRCVKQCCIKHDKCFRDNNCNFWSWFITGPVPIKACPACNVGLVVCMTGAMTNPSCPNGCTN
jgi:RHS repeat-associated protein